MSKSPTKNSKAKATAKKTPSKCTTGANPRNITSKPAARKTTVRKNSIRKSVQPRRPMGCLRRLARRLPLRALAILGAVTATISTGHWMWRSGYVEAAKIVIVEEVYAATADAGFAVTRIRVTGREVIEEEAVYAALETERGDPILRFDPEEARARVEALPWIEQAIIQRRLPDQILVKLEEQRPVALWQSQGTWQVIDYDGTVIKDADVRIFRDLPKLVGEGAEAHVAEFLSLTEKQPNLAEYVYAAIRVGKRRWNLRLHSGIDVRLPENNPISAW